MQIFRKGEGIWCKSSAKMAEYSVEGDYIVCIFCGGTCGGVEGNAILPSATLGISLVVLKIQAIRASHKQKLKEKGNKKQAGNKPKSSAS